MELRVTRGRPPSLYVVVMVLVVVMPAMRRPSDVDRSIKFPIDVVTLLDSCVEVVVDEGSRRRSRRLRPWKGVSHLHLRLLLAPSLVGVVSHRDSVVLPSLVRVVFHLESVDWVRLSDFLDWVRLSDFLFQLDNLVRVVWRLCRVDFAY